MNLPQKRYIRKGKCIRCGWCCSHENCEYFIMENDLATCLIYNRERPLKCTLYPDAPPILHEGCGYWFIDTWENNKIVKRKL